MGGGTGALWGLVGFVRAFCNYELDGLVVAYVHDRGRCASIALVSVLIRGYSRDGLPSVDLLKYALILGVVVAHQRAVLDTEAFAPQVQMTHSLLCS